MLSEAAKSEFSTAQRIFKVPYYVSVPRNMIQDSDFERYRGSNSSGSEVLDRASLDAQSKCHLPISRLAEIHQLIGGSRHIYFSCPRDQTPEIYKSLVEHINVTKVILAGSYTRDSSYEETVADLQCLDDFASWVWKIARNYMKEDDLAAHDSLEARGGSRRTPMSRGPILNTEEVDKRRMADQQESEHTPLMKDYVETDFVSRRGGWIGG